MLIGDTSKIELEFGCVGSDDGIWIVMISWKTLACVEAFSAEIVVNKKNTGKITGNVQSVRIAKVKWKMEWHPNLVELFIFLVA